MMIICYESWFYETLLMYVHMEQLSNRYRVCNGICLALNLQEFGCAKVAIFRPYTKRKI